MKWASEDEALSAGAIHQIVWEVREGTADPDDIRAVLAQFCEAISTGDRLEPAIFQYLRDAFAAYLSGGKTLEAALGLRGKKGARETARERDELTAAAVLRHMLNGDLFAVATMAVASEMHRGRSQVERAWGRYKQSALILVRIERGSRAFTAREKRRLEEIFKGEVWFLDSSKSAHYEDQKRGPG